MFNKVQQLEFKIVVFSNHNRNQIYFWDMSSTHKEHDRHEYIEHENKQREEEAKKRRKSINNLIYSMALYEYILNVLLELKLDI